MQFTIYYNLIITLFSVLVIRRTQNYIPIAFPKAYLTQSDSVFAFNSMQTVDEAIRDLYDNYHNTMIGRQDPIVSIYS